MGLFKRQNIVNSGLNGLAEKSINDNFMNIFKKINGDIDYENVNRDVKGKLNREWIPFQGEGNFDSFHPLNIRFFISPNLDIKKATVSIVLSNYRMDSGVANANKVSVNADVSISGGTQVGGGFTTDVLRWATRSESGGVNAPDYAIDPTNGFASIMHVSKLSYNNGASAITVGKGVSENTLGLMLSRTKDDSAGNFTFDVIDYAGLQHIHKQAPHGHNFSGTTRVTFPQHDHPLEEGIHISGTLPSNIVIGVNGSGLGFTLQGNAVMNEHDITNTLRTGWNEMVVTTSTLARATVYGVVEGEVKT